MLHCDLVSNCRPWRLVHTMKHHVGYKVCDSSFLWLEFFLKISMLHSWCWALYCHGNSFLDTLVSLLLEVEISFPSGTTQADIHQHQQNPDDDALCLHLLHLLVSSCHQLQGSPLHERVHGGPLHPLNVREDHHHHVYLHHGPKIPLLHY